MAIRVLLSAGELEWRSWVGNGTDTWTVATRTHGPGWSMLPVYGPLAERLTSTLCYPHPSYKEWIDCNALNWSPTRSTEWPPTGVIYPERIVWNGDYPERNGCIWNPPCTTGKRRDRRCCSETKVGTNSSCGGLGNIRQPVAPTTWTTALGAEAVVDISQT